MPTKDTPSQFVFGDIIVYSDNQLIARHVYEEVIRQRITCESGTVVVNGKPIRWKKFPSIP